MKEQSHKITKAQQGKPVRANDFNAMRRAVDESFMEPSIREAHRPSIRRFEVQEENDDTLDCVVPGQSSLFVVAKDFGLRGTNTGLFVAGMMIFAVRNILGGTGIPGVEWQNLNVGAVGRGFEPPPPPVFFYNLEIEPHYDSVFSPWKFSTGVSQMEYASVVDSNLQGFQAFNDPQNFLAPPVWFTWEQEPGLENQSVWFALAGPGGFLYNPPTLPNDGLPLAVSEGHAGGAIPVIAENPDLTKKRSTVFFSTTRINWKEDYSLALRMRTGLADTVGAMKLHVWIRTGNLPGEGAMKLYFEQTTEMPTDWIDVILHARSY